MEKKTIGSFIAALRKSSGMTQQELADRLNVSNKTVSKWECDDGYPELTLIPVIAEIFNVTSDEILRGGRISKDEQPEKVVAKTEQQANRLITNSIYKFKIRSLISFALSICGFVILLVIAYGLFRPYIALGCMILFILASFIMGIANSYTIKNSVNSFELFDKEDHRLINCNIIANRYFFYLVLINTFFLVTGLLIGLMGDAYSVVTFEYFTSTGLPYLLAFIIPVFFYSYIIYKIKEQKKLNNTIYNDIVMKSKLQKLNISFWVISGILLFIYFAIPLINYIVIMYQNNNAPENTYYGGTPTGPALYFILLIILSSGITYLLLRKKYLKSYNNN